MNLRFIPISDLKDANVSIFSQYKENQLVHFNEPELGLFIAESPKVIFRALDAGYEPVSLLVEDKTIESREASELWEKLRRMPSEEHTVSCSYASEKEDAYEKQNYTDDPLEDGTGSGEGFPVPSKEEDRELAVPVYVGDMKLLSQITGFKLTRGVLCAMKRRKLPDVKELCKNFRRIAVLENVVNPTNVGAIFRSAAALNIDAVLMTSGCSDPLYRRSARVSMGTVFQIPWTYISSEGHSCKTTAISAAVSEDKFESLLSNLVGGSYTTSSKPDSCMTHGGKNDIKESTVLSKKDFSGTDVSRDRDVCNEKPFWPEKGMELLKSMGFKTAAMALRDRSVSIDNPELMKEPKLAIILGTEGEGLMDETIRACDYVVKIPMSHGVDSLNVAAASAVVFWQLGQKGVQDF